MTSVDANAPLGTEQDTFAGAVPGTGLDGEIAAGGTLPRKSGVSQPGLWRSIWLALEIVVL